MPIFRPRIAIAGGGPSGLALGLLLHRYGIRPTIYELRSEPTKEELAKPSGMLDLHEESGLKVMRELGLWDSFQAAVGDCSEAQRVVNTDGVLLHADEGEFSSRPEIPRHALTNLLVQSLPTDVIKWNHKIVAVQSTKNPTTGATEITLDLGSNGSATYDFVIGADGAWSRVRKLLLDTKPIYDGTQLVIVTARHVSTKYPHLVDLSGSGSLMALGNHKGIMSHRGPQDSIRVYAAVSTQDENWAALVGLEGKTAVEVKTKLLSDEKLFRDWAAPLKDLLATVCDEETKDNPGCSAEILPMYMLPLDQPWKNNTGVTLIGDAAHLMPPWAGEGVNMALWDSLDLAEVLTTVTEADDAMDWQKALEPRLRKFEEEMLARAQQKAKEATENKEKMLGENGAQAMADWFKKCEAMAAAGGLPVEQSRSEVKVDY